MVGITDPPTTLYPSPSSPVIPISPLFIRSEEDTPGKRLIAPVENSLDLA
jgi:hypothetical protein